MKKLALLFTGLLTAASAVYAEDGITLTTGAAVGSEIKFLVNVKSATQPVVVDFGDGESQYFTINPTQIASSRWINGTVKGSTIRVNGDVTEFACENQALTAVSIEGMKSLQMLELKDNKIVDFEFVDEAPVTHLDLSNNKLENYVSYNANLSLDKVGTTLTTLDLSGNNDLRAFNMVDLTALEYLTAHDCEQLSSLFICAPEDSQNSLRSIDLSNCDLAHFYPVSLPELRTLNLANNSLSAGEYDSDPFVMGDYPNLTTLNVSGNFGITTLDVTSCTKLTSIKLSDCLLSALDLSQNKELLTLDIANNFLTSLDLGANKSLQYIYVANNPIKELDLKGMDKLRGLDISGTEISRIDLFDSYFLNSFVGSKSALEFVDFNSIQPDQMTLVDLRDCANFTPMSMAYTVKTLPVARDNQSSGTNLYLKGSHPEIADIAYATSTDMHWRCDSEGDGSATFPKVSATVENATLTTDRVKGTLERLYPYGGISLDYDLGVYEGEDGKFLLAQWQPDFFQTIASVDGEIRQGVPAYVYTYPAEGKKFRSVTVNGKEIFSPWFMVSGDKATISVNFEDEESSVVLTTQSGRALSFCVSTGNGGTIEIDWGTGTRTAYKDVARYQSGNFDFTGTRIDGTASADVITIYGDIAGVDVSCFGEVGEEMFGLPDNHFTSVDVSGCADLKMLNLYWNPVSELDLSKNTSLEFLDFSYTAVKNIDLSKNTALLYLAGYANSDELGANFAQISNIDLTGLTHLQQLDLHNQNLASVDLSVLPELTALNVANNHLSTLDVTSNPELLMLRAGSNALKTIDLSKNTKLLQLAVDDNDLTEIDLSENVALEEVTVANNLLKTLDTSMLPELGKLYINGNGMNAEQLNDVYYLLPERKAHLSDDDQMTVSFNLFVNQAGDRTANDGEGADGSLAIARLWNPTPDGNNSGSTTSYLTIEAPAHGSVVVKDAQGTIYESGMTVKKYTNLTIEATPAEGYRYEGFRLNGEDLTAGNTFMMPGIYTVLEPVFVSTSGIEGVSASDAVEIYVSAAGEIVVEGPDAAVAVYAVDGRIVAKAQVSNGMAVINTVGEGTYIVRVAGAEVSTAKTIVK